MSLIMHSSVLCSVLCGVLGLSACTANSPAGLNDTGLGSATTTGPACWTDLSAGDKQTLAAGFDEGTEGLAFVDGRLFVGTPTQVIELSGDGTATSLWKNNHVLGLAAVGTGLWVADPGEFSFGGDTDGQLWSLSLNGQATLLSEGWSNPNFLTQTPWGTILLSDDTATGLWELNPSGSTIGPALSTVDSPNGIVATDTAITVASTFSADGEIWRAPVSEGVAGTEQLLTTTVAGGANDGLALGPDGSVWVAVNLAGELWRIDPDGQASRFVDGLSSPASLGFGEGANFDPCSLYVTSLFGNEVMRVAVGAN